MRTVLLALALFFSIPIIKAQQWQNVTPSGYDGSFFSSSFFLTDQKGWLFARPIAFGNYDLLYTSDGAQTFEKLLSLTNNMECWNIQMVDSSNGYAKIENTLAHENYFWRTTDGGRTWLDITDTTLFNNGKPLHSSHAFYFTSLNTGYFAGINSIYKTENSGLNWVKMNTPAIIDSVSSNMYRANSIYFVNEKYGWAACSLVIDAGFAMKTTDSGANWTVCTPITGDLLNIHFADSMVGGITGSSSFFSAILLTTDNFQTEPAFNFQLNQHPFAICYQNDSTIWFGGSPPILNRSTDGGLTFEKYDTAYAETNENGIILNICFFGNTGYAHANLALLKFVDTLNTTAKEAIILNDDVLISPNPISDKCKVSFSLLKSGITSFEIFTIEGILTEKTTKLLPIGKSEVYFDLSHLKPGIYLLRVKTSAQQFTKQLIRL